MNPTSTNGDLGDQQPTARPAATSTRSVRPICAARSEILRSYYNRVRGSSIALPVLADYITTTSEFNSWNNADEQLSERNQKR
jgi:hypothetical protein